MFNFRQISVNLAGSVLPMAVILFSVPMFLDTIGAAKYGILSLVWIVFGYFGVFDFGVARAVTHAISRARDSESERAEIVWSAVAIGCTVGTAIAILAGVGCMWWTSRHEDSQLAGIVPALPMLVIGVPIVIVSTIFNAALDGQERFKLANAIQATGAILFQIVPLLVARWVSVDLVDLIDSIIYCRALVLVVYAVAMLRVFKLHERFGASRLAIQKLLKFGSHVALINFLDPVFSKIDQIFVAHFSGGVSVAAYNIAINSAGRLSILPLAMSRSIFPKLSVAQDRSELFAAKSRILWIWFLICACAIVASDTMFHLWLRNEIWPDVSAVAKILIVGLWANCLSVLPYTALQARGLSRSILKAHLFEMPFYVAALFGLTNAYGASGAAIAFVLRNFLDYVVLWWMYGHPIVKHFVFAMLFLVLAMLVPLTHLWPIDLFGIMKD